MKRQAKAAYIAAAQTPVKKIPQELWPLLTVTLIASCGSMKPGVQEPGAASRASKSKLTRTQGGDPHAAIVRCGLQDKAGNLWFGTIGEGVYRYDGSGFTQYTVRDGLKSNIVWSILEGGKGRILFGTDSGLSRWDGKRVRNVPIPSQPAVWSLREDKRGTLWIDNSVGMYCAKTRWSPPS